MTVDKDQARTGQLRKGKWIQAGAFGSSRSLQDGLKGQLGQPGQTRETPVLQFGRGPAQLREPGQTRFAEGEQPGRTALGLFEAGEGLQVGIG